MNKSFGLFFIFCLLFPGIISANEESNYIIVDDVLIKLSAQSYEKDILSYLAKDDSIFIPLRRAGNLLLLEAEIDGQVGNFIVDLGAPYLVLNSTYFRDYEIDDDYYAGTLASGTEHVKRIEVHKLNIQGLEYYNLSADVIDLAAIENKRGIKILGLLGVSLFKRYVFDLNIFTQQLILYKGFTSEKMQSELILDSPIQLRNNVIILDVKAGDVELKFSIDSGAERNVLDNSLPEKVYEGMQILGASAVTDGNGARTEVLIAEIYNINIADFSMQKMRTLVLNLGNMSRAYDNKINGMLGFPFFTLGRVIIDFKEERIRIYQHN
jgi:predicted aspartyl protease